MFPFSKRLWLSSPTTHAGDFTYVADAYQKNWLSTVGENIQEVERAVAERTGCRYAVALSSGTAALHLSVRLSGISAGDTVFCSDMTFAASVNPILYEKATPILIDAEYDTWNMDPAALEQAFARFPGTKAIVLVDLYGTPAKYDEITAVADRYGAVIIEDAAEAFGATYRGKSAGSFGQFRAISFNGNKIITGSAGGMLLTDDATAAELAHKWSAQSRESAPWYQHVDIGYNYRMSNLVAGMVRGQLPYLEEHVARKKTIYERYKNAFSDLPVTMNPYEPDTMEPNFWLSCLLINQKAMCRQTRTDRNASFIPEKGKTCPTEILQTLDAYHAEGRPIWKPMHMQPLLTSAPLVTSDGLASTDSEGAPYAVSRDIFDRGLCLPSDIKMTDVEQDNVIEIVRSCFE